MPGAAITEVEIDNVQHEYETLEGVREDVINILLNLKGVAIVLHDTDHATITLSRNGEGESTVVRAADFTLSQDVEIINQDHVNLHPERQGRRSHGGQGHPGPRLRARRQP